MTVTLKDVAEKAGVSRGTVDRVIYNRGIVNSETKAKVLSAIEELQYTPNVSARALVKTHDLPKIGVIIPNQAGFFHDEVLRGIQRETKECNAVGITVIVAECDANNPSDYLAAIDNMCGAGILALAVCAQNSRALINKINELTSSGIPVITVNSDIPESHRCAFVGEDSLQSGRIAGQMMAKMISEPGAILVVGGRQEFAAHTNRVKGFSESLKEHSRLTFDLTTSYTYEDHKLTYDAVRIFFESHSDIRGVYLATSSVPAYVEALRDSNIQRPVSICHDIPPATLGYLRSGDIDFTIEQNIYRQGSKPIRMFRDHLINGTPITDEQVRTFYNVISSECIV